MCTAGIHAQEIVPEIPGLVELHELLQSDAACINVSSTISITKYSRGNPISRDAVHTTGAGWPRAFHDPHATLVVAARCSLAWPVLVCVRVCSQVSS